MGRSYTIDFNSMQQINEDTGTARPVQRKLNSFGVPQPTGIKLIVYFIIPSPTKLRRDIVMLPFFLP